MTTVVPLSLASAIQWQHLATPAFSSISEWTCGRAHCMTSVWWHARSYDTARLKVHHSLYMPSSYTHKAVQQTRREKGEPLTWQRCHPGCSTAPAASSCGRPPAGCRAPGGCWGFSPLGVWKTQQHTHSHIQISVFNCDQQTEPASLQRWGLTWLSWQTWLISQN